MNSLQDRDGDRAIHHAAFGNQPSVVHLLCTVFDADVNARNKRGQTPLHIAVNRGYGDVCRVLLRINCLPNLQVSDCIFLDSRNKISETKTK